MTHRVPLVKPQPAVTSATAEPQREHWKQSPGNHSCQQRIPQGRSETEGELNDKFDREGEGREVL